MTIDNLLALSGLASHAGRGKLVHRCHDALGDILVVDQGAHRILTFDTVYEQSRFNLEQPACLEHHYTRAMLLGLAFLEPRHISLFGLGSGCLLQAFNHMFENTDFEVVEYRQAVVDVAKMYFDLPVSSRLNIAVADAGYHIKSMATSSTDMIFADMYTAEDMNPLQQQPSFVRQCHRVLDEEGWLIANFHHLPEMSSEFFVALQKYFQEILIYRIPEENYIIYAGKQRLLNDLEKYLPRTRWFPYNDKIRYDELFKRIVRLTI